MGLIVVGLVIAGALLLYMQGESEEATVPPEVSGPESGTAAQRQPEPQPKPQASSPEPAVQTEAPIQEEPVEGGIRIAGHVVNEDTDEPLANFGLTMKIGEKSRKTTTSETGEFEFTGLWAAYVWFRIDHPELVVTSKSAGVQLLESAAIENLTIYVRSGAVVTGRIYDADTDEGIGGITVNAKRNGNRRQPSTENESTTDDDGRYRFDVLQDGAYQINPVRIDGYPATQYAMYELNVVETSFDVPGEKDFALNRGIGVSGVVVDENGEPLEKAFVRGSADGNLVDAWTTDAEGRFQLFGFNAGANVQLTAAYEYSVMPNHAVQIQNAPVTDVLLMVIPMSRVAGRLVDTGGKAIPNRYVSFRSDGDGGNRGVINIRSQPNGSFRLDQVGSGTYAVHLMVGRESDPKIDPLLDTITLAKGQVIENLTLVVDESLLPQMTISGRVINDIGAPVAVAHLQARVGSSRSISAETDENGLFTIARLKEGSYRISASAHEHAQFNKQDVLAGTVDLNIVLQRNGTVEGTFVDAGTRQPIIDFGMVVRNSGPQDLPRKDEFIHYHDDAGKFVAARFNPNRTSHIWVKAEGYAVTAYPVSGIRSGETRTGTVIPLELETIVQGRVVDDSGNPVAGAQIFPDEVPRNESGKRNARLAISDAQGRFELEGYGRGRHSLTAFRPGQFPVVERFDVQANPTEVTFVFGEGATLEVLVTMDGWPVHGANVRLDAVIAESGKVTDNNFARETDAEGRVVIRGLPSGMAPMEVQANGRNIMRMMRFEVGTVEKAVFDLTSATSSLEGFVMISETESAQARVQLIMDAGGAMETKNTTTDEDGFYRFENLPAGTINLRATFSGSQDRNAVSTELGVNENRRFDIKMYGGGSLQFQVSDVPPESETTLFLFSEETELWDAMTIAEIMDIYPSAKGESNLREGIGAVTNVAAGSYKVLVVAIQQNTEQTMGIAGQIIAPITVKEGEEKTIELSF
jgi:hypothetical protein